MGSYIYTPDDIKKIIEEKRAKGDVRNAALEKARLMQLREAARGKGDSEEESRQDVIYSIALDPFSKIT